jgi:hypothetical protein
MLVKEAGCMAKTGEEIGYEDAMRQVQRCLQRRLKALEESLRDAEEEAKKSELRARILEVKHIMQIVESLHR